MKTIKVTTDNKIRIIDVDFDDYKDIQRAVGGYFETVSTKRTHHLLGPETIFLVDEEGLCKGLPKNLLGCFLYGTPFHGCPIAGDLILAKRSGEDITAPDDVEELVERLLMVFNLEVVEEDE